MLSLEIFRNYRNLSITDLIRRANISRQSYYNALSGLAYITPAIISKIDKALDLNGLLQFTFFFDRMHQLGVKLNSDSIILPDRFPPDLLLLFYKHHPIFTNNCINNLYIKDVKVKKIK